MTATTHTIPEAPPITHEREYIEWFVQYSDKVAEERHAAGIYAQGERLKAFVAEHTDRAMDLLEKCPDAKTLFDRVEFLAGDSQVKISAILGEYGGLKNCPEPQKLMLIGLLIHIAIAVEMMSKKYVEAHQVQPVPELH